MKTQAELDAEYQAWLGRVAVAIQIRNRIVESGGMATKTRVEDELMPLFDIDRYDAHQIMNHIEYHNLK